MVAGMITTNHSRKRLRGRAIPEEVVGWLLDFGERIQQTDNRCVYFFTPSSRKKVIKNISPSKVIMLEKKAHVFLVVDEQGILITAGYRYKRLFSY